MNVIDFLQHREHGNLYKKRILNGIDSVCNMVEIQTSNINKNQVCELSGVPRATFLMDFSKDGTKIASTHGDHTVRVTAVSSGKCTHVLKGHPRTPWCLSFHPSSNDILASGCLGGEVRIWDLHGGGSEVWHPPSNGVIASLTFHPTDHVLVFATGNIIYFWDWNKSEPFACSQTCYEFERIRWLRFDPLGHYLYTGIANNTTVHREEPSNVLHIIDPGNTHTSRFQQYANVRRYQQVLQRYQDYQRERSLHSQQDLGIDVDVDMNDSSSTNSATADRLQPEHASIEHRLRRAGNYAASINATARRAREIVSSIPNSRWRHHLRLTELRRVGHLQTSPIGTWSPPPRVWPSSADESSYMEQDDFTTRMTPPQLSEIAEVAAQRPLLVRPNTSSPSALHSSLFPRSSARAPSEMSRRTNAWSAENESNIRSGATLQSSPRPFQSRSLRTNSNSDTLWPSMSILRSRQASSAFHEVPRTTSRSNVPARASLFPLVSSSQSSDAPQTTTVTSSTASNIRSETTQNRPGFTRRLLSILFPHTMPDPTTPNASSLPGTRGNGTSQARRQNASDNQNQAAASVNGASQASGTIVQAECLREGAADTDAGQTAVGINAASDRTRVVHVISESPVLESGSEDEMVGEAAIEEEDAMIDNDSMLEDVASSESVVDDDALDNSDQNNNPAGQEDLTSLTMRLERQVTELDRRITALRERFTERLLLLHQDRERILHLRGQISNQSSPDNGDLDSTTDRSETTTPPHVPLITVTGPRDPQGVAQPNTTPVNNTSFSQGRGSGSGQNTQLLEMFLRGDGPVSNTISQPPLPPPSMASVRVTPSRLDEAYNEPRSWHSLQQRHLHPHYSMSILDDTINRPNDALHAAINRAIAGAFMGSGERAVASNIIPQTHRIQRWDFTKCHIPDISQTKASIVVPHCKLHNDASCDISQDASLLATFVPSHRGFPDDNILGVFSIQTSTIGQCLFTKSFGPNAISVSISPHNQLIMVGLAAKRLSWVSMSNQLVAQVYKMDKENSGEASMRHVCDVFHPCDTDIRTHISVNSARWLRGLGEGLVYGTNRGDLHICRSRVKRVTMKANEEFPETSEPVSSPQPGRSVHMNLMSMLDAAAPNTSSIATQTLARSIRRTAGTQTDSSGDQTEEEEDEDDD